MQAPTHFPPLEHGARAHGNLELPAIVEWRAACTTPQ
jgi:hypothetical protein